MSSDLSTPNFPVVHSQLKLLKQSSPTQEKVSKNGLQKNVHVVVKNTPFLMQLALTSPLLVSGAVLDFKSLAVDVCLCYDNDSLKQVGFVKTKPLEVKTAISESGDQASLNVKIKVLTSQHEDMFFRVKVRVIEPKSKREFTPPLEILSEPIKVISKPKQIRRRRTTKRRSLNDMLIETVQRIEQQQQTQYSVIASLVGKKRKRSLNESFFPSQSNSTSNNEKALNLWVTDNNQNQDMNEMEQEKDEFVIAVQQFLTAYSELPIEEKPRKIRRVLRSFSSAQTEQFSILLQNFTNPISGDSSSKKNSLGEHDEGCDCLNCPHKLELSRIDEFYKEFLASDSLNLGGLGNIDMPPMDNFSFSGPFDNLIC
eukprot:CAMPEP_0174262128 /NCGR_PEP_ID=MMETSP0439-20130205/12786_1 /TAXON_ID=0 /ORGANISM="Stereomyxa ramosa, Strain Chinc5" /LENGTH=368 /DNA_ID=CAMNT_0015346777 /DNA_START=106 /DNA_END=1212 /DNA_ORIENTATION=+